MSPLVEQSDQELVALLRQTDPAAFTVLYERYNKIIYAFLYKFLKSPELTDDLTQEVFMKLWDNRADLPQLASLKSYLLTLAKHHTFDFLRRTGVDRNAKAVILSHYPVNPQLTLEDELHYADYKRYLDGVLATLTPQSREVFRLCRQEGRTYDEVAEALGISRSAVKKHMVRSMRILGDSVQRDLGVSFTVLMAVLFEHYSR